MSVLLPGAWCSKDKLRPGATRYGYAGWGQAHSVKDEATCGFTSSIHTGFKTDGPLQGLAPGRNQRR